jgi:glycosyltransferase involved in cell wall biosynthesis
VHSIQPAPDPGPGPLRFLFIGILIPTKGADRVIEAHSRLACGKSSLSIVGDPVPFFGSEDYLQSLRAQARTSPNVVLRKPVPSTEINDLLASHDVLVLPSTWAENSPLVVREATAAGLRTILTSLGGASELDPLAQTVDPDRLDELVQAMEAEIEKGRGRNPLRSWPGPLHIARWHIENSYGVGNSRSGVTPRL